jgi:hypothetical protein
MKAKAPIAMVPTDEHGYSFRVGWRLIIQGRVL